MLSDFFNQLIKFGDLVIVCESEFSNFLSVCQPLVL